MIPLYDKRKTIQEVNCLALDIILATAFDWKELANRLSSSGRNVPYEQLAEHELPFFVQRMSHSACHIETEFADGIGSTLDSIHEKIMTQTSKMELHELCPFVREFHLETNENISGLLWALGTDSRDGIDKILNTLAHKILSELLGCFRRHQQNNFESKIKVETKS